MQFVGFVSSYHPDIHADNGSEWPRTCLGIRQGDERIDNVDRISGNVLIHKHALKRFTHCFEGFGHDFRVGLSPSVSVI